MTYYLILLTALSCFNAPAAHDTTNTDTIFNNNSRQLYATTHLSINTDTLCANAFRESVSKTTHKYYLSVSTIKYNAKTAALQMITRFFVDDFEDVLSARTDQNIVLGNPEQAHSHKQLIADYVSKKLKVNVDQQSVSPIYLGADFEYDQILLYIEIPINKVPSQIKMQFTALMELFEDQKNMVNVTINGKRKTLLMTMDKKKDQVKF